MIVTSAERSAQSFRNALRGRDKSGGNRSLRNLGDNEPRSLTRMTIAPRHRPRRKALAPAGRNAKRARPDRRGRRRARRRFRFAYRSAARLGRARSGRRRLALSGLRIRRCLVSDHRRRAPRLAVHRRGARKGRRAPRAHALRAAQSRPARRRRVHRRQACQFQPRPVPARAGVERCGALGSARRRGPLRRKRASISMRSSISRAIGRAASIRSPRSADGRARASATSPSCPSPSKRGATLDSRRSRGGSCARRPSVSPRWAPYRTRIARDEAEAARTLDALIALRCDRARREGVLDAYENSRCASLSSPSRDRRNRRGSGSIMELHALMLDERAVAAFAALSGRDRLSGLVIAYDADPEIARCSPGELDPARGRALGDRARIQDLRSRRGRGALQERMLRGDRNPVRRLRRRKPAWPSRRPRLPPRAARQANRQAFAQAVGLGGAPAPPELQAASWKAGSADFTLKARISG